MTGAIRARIIDDETYTIFSQRCGRLLALRKFVGNFDLLIGATGLHYALTILTNTRRHIELVKGFALSSQ